MSDRANPELVTVALDRVEGAAFERFVNAFYPAVSGSAYVPLGGVHDGGADGFFDTSVLEVSTRKGSFLQSSTQEDHRAKIRQTVARLREFGRVPTSLTYATSRFVQHIDQEEEALSDELGLVVRIRDRRYIASQINTSRATVAAFDQYLRPYLAFLSTPGNVPLIQPMDQVRSPAVYVFLRQEVERRAGNTTLLDAVSDGLILWALEGTDPDANILMGRAQILAKIVAAVPPAKQFIRGTIKRRLEQLSAKNNPTGRAVRWYKKEDLFCLPFETRVVVEEENASDEALRLFVKEILANRASAESSGAVAISMSQASLLAETALRALQITFEKEGLEFSSFLSGGEQSEEEYSVSDSIDKAMEQMQLAGGGASRFQAGFDSDASLHHLRELCGRTALPKQDVKNLFAPL